MKKLAPYMLAGFLSVSVASPALSDVGCGFIKKQVIDEMRQLRLYDAALQRHRKNLNFDGEYRATGELKKEVQQSLNYYANIFSTFCKE